MNMKLSSFLLGRILPAEKAGMKGGRFHLKKGKVADLYSIEVLADRVTVETHLEKRFNTMAQSSKQLGSPQDTVALVRTWGQRLGGEQLNILRRSYNGNNH